VEDDSAEKAKRWARIERFSEHLPAHVSEVVGKGKGKFRAVDRVIEGVARSQKKSRWGRKGEANSPPG